MITGITQTFIATLTPIYTTLLFWCLIGFVAWVIVSPVVFGKSNNTELVHSRQFQITLAILFGWPLAIFAIAMIFFGLLYYLILNGFSWLGDAFARRKRVPRV